MFNNKNVFKKNDTCILVREAERIAILARASVQMERTSHAPKSALWDNLSTIAFNPGLLIFFEVIIIINHISLLKEEKDTSGQTLPL